jgi:phosphatidylserine/phosphatidylglycerophosphate/cardiolipin synthase-like enzyme
MTIKSQIKAFANCDHVIIAWRYDDLIPNCIGFALYKKVNNETAASAEPLPNHIGFAGQDPKPGEQRPSTEWPIQRFTWTDYDVNPNDSISYMVIPILWNGTSVNKDTANGSDWSENVTVATGKDFEAYFNRGIISSQFMSRQLDNLKATDKQATLADTLQDPNSTIRKFLGGVLAEKLFSEMDEVISDTDITIYAALYELNEEIFIGKLKEINDRVNLILANGAFQKKPHNDENYDVREDIRSTSKINLYDRIVTGKHFAHNKFIVFCKKGKPYKVWTGSTNTTENGLYTQVNNAVIINDATVAKWYLDEWAQMKDAGNLYPPEYVKYNSAGHPAHNETTTWFAPVDAQEDMNAARTLIANAKEGILFLFFNPGTTDTLYNAIIDKYTKSDADNFFVHGIMNQDPGGKVHPLIFIHKGKTDSTNYDTLMPKSINDEFSYWASEIHPKMVTIHSKVVVIDPFGKNPVVMTGSHNDGNKASEFNDDNLNIIEGNVELATQYAVNILSVYDHFHWRYSLAQNNKGAVAYQGLSTDVNWMKSYLSGNNLAELNFMLGAATGAAKAKSTPLHTNGKKPPVHHHHS